MDNEVMCQGHKCYKMIPLEKARSPYSINCALCPECYKELQQEMREQKIEIKEHDNILYLSPCNSGEQSAKIVGISEDKKSVCLEIKDYYDVVSESFSVPIEYIKKVKRYIDVNTGEIQSW
jgi:hypothetical protein